MVTMESYNSQEHHDYWNEYRYPDEERPSDDSQDEELGRTNDDGDSDTEFFRATGLDFLYNYTEGNEENAAKTLNLLDTLTHRQAEVLRKRLSNSIPTIRKKGNGGKGKVPDVREVFTQSDLSCSLDTRSATPDSLDSISPCRTPPSPPGWLPIRTSPTPSQGYHSQTRSSPDRSESPDQTFHQPDIHPGDSNDGLHIDGSLISSTPEKPPVFLKVFQQGDRRVLSQYDEPLLCPSPRRHSKDVLDRRPSYDDNQGFPGPRRSSKGSPGIVTSEPRWRRNLVHSEIGHDDSGIEILGFQNKGSFYQTLSTIPIGKALYPRDPDIRQQDDVLPSARQDWGFEKRTSSTTEQGELPDLIQTSDKSGVTLIDDIGPDDVTKLQTFALLELMALFDHNDLRMRKRKRKRVKKDQPGAVFRVSLTSLVENDRKIVPDCKVPLILKKILSHLEEEALKEEGILRVSGATHKIQLLRSEVEFNFYTNRSQVEAALEASSNTEVVALLKQFLRELPELLLTSQYVDVFLQLTDLQDNTDKIRALKMLVILLPEAHRNSLRALLDFMRKVVEYEAYNRMSLHNVAMILAPNLFPLRKPRAGESSEKTIVAEMSQTRFATLLCKLLIKYTDIIWTIPIFLLKQVRQQNEKILMDKAAKENKQAKKDKGRKLKVDIYRKINNEVDFQAGIIRVNAPQFRMMSIPVQLSHDLTAGEVVSQFIQECKSHVELTARRNPNTKRSMLMGLEQSMFHCSNMDFSTAMDTHFLYEEGGNIEERKLEHGANLMTVYLENPNTRWSIRCHHAVVWDAR